MSVLPTVLTESRREVVELDDSQAEALRALGRRLAGRTDWWGAGAVKADESASAISVSRAGTAGQWWLRINEAIGLVSVGGRSVPVLPKIPLNHALELLRLAGAVPRMDSERAAAAEGDFLFNLLAHWLVRSVESVLRRDLMKEYRAHRDELSHVRGRISMKETTLALTRGIPKITCEFDELDRDNALNRALLAALRLVVAAPFATPDVRSRARRACARFDEVSALQHDDLRVEVTPRTSYYADSLAVARVLLRGVARSLDTGGEVAWAFLIRTPEAVEAGVRMVLHEELQPDFTVTKRGLGLLPSTKTLNPDLVFGDRAVGDVKYKLQDTDWDSGDLYQAVTFATGFRVKQAAIVTFSAGRPAHQPLQVGDVALSNFCWPADPSLSPHEAGAQLAASVRRWLEARPPEQRTGGSPGQE